MDRSFVNSELSSESSQKEVAGLAALDSQSNSQFEEVSEITSEDLNFAFL